MRRIIVSTLIPRETSPYFIHIFHANQKKYLIQFKKNLIFFLDFQSFFFRFYYISKENYEISWAGQGRKMHANQFLTFAKDAKKNFSRMYFLIWRKKNIKIKMRPQLVSFVSLAYDIIVSLIFVKISSLFIFISIHINNNFLFVTIKAEI